MKETGYIEAKEMIGWFIFYVTCLLFAFDDECVFIHCFYSLILEMFAFLLAFVHFLGSLKSVDSLFMN